MFTRIGSSTASVNALREGGDGRIWVGTTDGLFRLECKKSGCSLVAVDIGLPHAYTQQREVADVVEDRRGNVWVATPSGLYRRGSSGELTRFTTREGLPDDFLHTLFEDSHGQLWVGTRNAGLFRLDTRAQTPRIVERILYTAPDGQKTTWIYQIIEAADGTLWAGTHRGILELGPAYAASRQVRAFGTRNGLTNHEITALVEDVSGNLWLGSSSAGAMKLTRDGLFSYGERDGILGVNAVFGDGEGGVCFRAYVLGNPGVSVFEGARLDPLRLFDSYLLRFGRFDGERMTWMLPEAIAPARAGWVGEHVTLRARSGEWWIGTGDALMRFPPVRFAQLRNAKPIAVYPTEQVFRIFEDSAGNIWLSTTSSKGGGLCRWNKASAALLDIRDTPGLAFDADDLPTSFGEDAAGNVWVGFADSIARYNNGQFTRFRSDDGLPPGGINDIYLDRTGRLWFASSASGVVRIDRPQSTHPAFSSYAVPQGLSSNQATVLTEDLQGRIYAGTGRGLDRLDPATGRIRHFTTADGLAAGRFLAAYRDSTGTLWFGMTNGLSRFTPGRDRSRTQSEVLISSITVGGAPEIISAVGESEVILPEMNSGPNDLQFNFGALNFGFGHNVAYQYKLDGAPDAEWSAPTDQRTIHYANLRPGRYRFAVRRLSADGVASRKPATVRFTILPPVWQRWWFLSLVALVVALSAYAAYSYRVRHLLEVAKIRAHIAADLHDDIGSNFTKIAILSEVARRQLGDESDGRPLSAIAEISRQSVAAMSDIVWAINPERDTLVDLVRRMRRQAEEVFASDHPSVAFNASGTDENVKLGPVVRRDLFLTFKEALNNAARHSGCSHVDVDLAVDGRWLILRVADNGLGFDTGAEMNGQGLTSMRRRAHRMGGTLDIESRQGEGTTVRLRVPCRVTRWTSQATNPT